VDLLYLLHAFDLVLTQSYASFSSSYMNSILQCLNQIKPITSFFLKGEYLKEMNKNNPLGSGGRISTAYASFLNDVWGNDYSILAPRLLKQTVGSFAPQFNNNFQHDSQEFCQFLMDGLHEDLNRVKNKPYVEQFEAYGMDDKLAAEQSWRNHLKRHDSVFVDYTQGMHRSHLTCPGCGRESVKFDVYSSISLPLVPPKSGSSTIPLKDCLDQFAAGEQLDEHNAWYCSNCKRHVCALKLITLWNTPDILVFHLKRFTFEKCPDVEGRILKRKIEDTVNFPIDRLDMTEYVLGPVDPDAPPIYKLFGVSEHTGATANSGHYTATARNSEDGNWYRYNDSNVGFTSGDAAITGGAYLLFYQRSKGSLRWAGMEKELSGSSQPIVDEEGFQAVVGKKMKKKNRR
jgi:ubiquitin carboxyl-terminal hydrolase 8